MNEINKELEALFNELYQQLTGIATAKHDYIVFSEALQERKAKHKREIAEAKDDSGKKLYTNEDIRTAELYSRLSDDEEYQALKKKVQEMKLMIEQAEAKIEILRYKIQLRLTLLQGNSNNVLELQRKA